MKNWKSKVEACGRMPAVVLCITAPRLPALGVLLLIALFVTLAPMLSQFTYFDTDWGMMSSKPDMESGHYFGTDSSGRDLLVRVAIGGRISLMVGIAAALVAVIVGTLYGSLSGYLGGKTDSVMMRLLEILNSFPFMFFVILLVTFFGQNILLIFVAIGMVSGWIWRVSCAGKRSA